VPGLYRRFFGAGALRPDVDCRPAWGSTNDDNSCKHLTRQCARLNANSQSRLKRRVPHTLPRWPCTRGTTTASVVVTIVTTATTATTTAWPSWRWFSSACGLTRRLRLRDLDALRPRWCRVWMFGGGCLFAFLFSLNCLRHTKLLGERAQERKEKKEMKERTERGNVEFPTCFLNRRFRSDATLERRLCNIVEAISHPSLSYMCRLRPARRSSWTFASNHHNARFQDDSRFLQVY